VAANPFFSGRIPQQLLDKIEQHIAETGSSKTSILIRALGTYLEFPILPSGPGDYTAAEIRRLIVKQAHLEAELAGLRQFCIEQGYSPVNTEDKYTIKGG
jgi:hypothetical protein